MKIAVTYENGQVFQHFGKTKEFKLYTAEDGKITASEILGSGSAGHEALAGVLKDAGVDTLICGGLGGGAQAALAEMGIKVISGAAGNTDEAVEEYLAGNLVSQGVNCDHHGEDHHHGEGHHCGHHDHNGESEEASGCGYGHHDEESCDCGNDCEGDCGGCGGGCCGGSREMSIIYEGKNAGKSVSVHYTGTLDDGSKFDSSYDRNQPLSFVAGVGMMIPGFDQAVVDMEVGESRSIHIEPRDAYGEYNEKKVVTINVAEIPGAESLEIGQDVMLMNEMGMRFPVTVKEKTSESVTFDGNHRLAGKALNFDITLLEVAE